MCDTLCVSSIQSLSLLRTFSFGWSSSLALAWPTSRLHALLSVIPCSQLSLRRESESDASAAAAAAAPAAGGRRPS